MSEVPPNRQRFTNRKIRHKTRWSVRLADRVSSIVITVGGIGTIVSVSLVFVLLLAVVTPLFLSAQIETTERTPPTPWQRQRPLQIGLDEYRALAWALFEDGRFVMFRPDTGEPIGSQNLLPDGVRYTATSYLPTANHLALARSDGSIQFGAVRFETTFVEKDAVPAELSSLAEGQLETFGEGVLQRTPQGQFRSQRVAVQLQEPLALDIAPVNTIAHTLESRGPVFAVLSDRGELRWGEIVERRNVLTGKTTVQSKVGTLPLEAREGRWPTHLLVTRRGENVLTIWNDGWLVRYDVRNFDQPETAESLALLPIGTKATVSAATMAIGGETLLVGDSSGRLRAWFRARHTNAETSDGSWLLPIHELPSAPAGVTDLAISERSRMVMAGYEDGSVRVFHATTAQLLVESSLSDSQRVDWVVMAPKDDGLLAGCGGRLWQAALNPAYPEASFTSLLQPVWYEGYDQPEVIWQSSFAGVEAEMKLSLVPLIFGTIKATVYSMLFGAPIALLAAIYTSEFLSPRLRTKVKSVIELMASLPSVVLGFLGGLVIAPFVEGFVPSVLCAFFTLPFALLAGAFLWQQLPATVALRFAPVRLLMMLLALIVGIFAARWAGPWVETHLFAGDLFLWLDRQRGTGIGAWLILLFPVCCLLVTILIQRTVNPWLARISTDWTRQRFGVMNLSKFILGSVAALLLAFAISQALTWSNLDPRGTYVGTYVQRNALVVGFVMGFAIIPIIYTISEDALSTVPQHLRSASLGAGATPWQTAVRVVIPTAMSGLFSAMMIGLGRAVGETMIVLMAAGNTPVLEWNLFNGFRTLSANIAVELPEAVRDSTHYRTLFLAALTLLLMTFVVNTAAELVRLRFRRRAVQL